MPNLGQGGCQAIEDAYILTEILAKTRTTEKIEDGLQEFYRKRIVRASTVQLMSRLASDLIINAFDTPWSPHDNLGKSWKSYLTFFWKVCVRYFRDFCLRFSFLTILFILLPLAYPTICYFSSPICLPLLVLSFWQT